MATKTLGSAIVRFISQGIGKLKAEIGVVSSSVNSLADANVRAQRKIARAAREAARAAQETRKQWDDLGASFRRAGTLALGTLAAGTAAAVGFLRLSDPRGMDNLGIAIFKIGVQLGRFFVPAVRAATAYVERAAQWLKDMSDSTRENVFQAMKWTAAILAGAGAFAVLASAVLPLVGHLRTLGHTIGIVRTALAAAGVAPWIAGIAGILTVLSVVQSGLSGFTEQFITLWTSVQNLFVSVWLSVQPLVESFLVLAESILPIFAGALSLVLNVITLLINAVTWVVQTFGTFAVTAALTYVALSSLPMVIGKIISGFTGLVGIARSVISGIQGMSSAMAAFAANPWTAVLIGISLAVGAIVAAFASASRAAEDFGDRMTRLDALRSRLLSGGRVRREDLRDFLSADEEREFIRTPEADRPAMLRRLRAEAEARLARLPGEGEVGADDAAARGALESTRDLGGPTGIFALPAVRIDRMERRMRALRDAGVSESTISRIGSTVDLTADSLSSADIRRAIDTGGSGADRRAIDTRIRGLRRLEESGMEGDSDRFRGEMRIPAARFMSSFDLARNIQTASVDDPETRRHEELMRETRGLRETVTSIHTDTTALATGTRGVLPGR